MHQRISFAVIAVLAWATSDQLAVAQHHHHGHGHSYWGSGHYHYRPSHFDVHRGHLDYHPGTTTFHSTPGHSIGGHNHGHHHHYYGGYGYGSAWLTPIVTQPVISQPSTVIVNATPAQPQQLPEPRFGAYAQVPRVADDLASFANNLCLTMHKRFQNQPGFNGTYRIAYGVLQQAQFLRNLSSGSPNREELARRLPRIDEDMHRLTAEISPWVGDQSGASADDVAALKQDVGQVGGALHYLMVDVGVAHKDQDPAVAARQSQPLPPPPQRGSHDPQACQPGRRTRRTKGEHSGGT
ncbi:MAG: hypothetical protein FD138_3236 [Planctomycetota bacterium]|nr:MAG: hypothetical protein FD138_3236 [Planctomycetota bacterium]